MKKFLEMILMDNLRQLEEENLLTYLKVLSSPQGPWVNIGEKRLLNLSSNNYLGFNTHPLMVKSAIEATERWGVGSGAVRTIAGTLQLHMDLENELAHFKQVESTLVFQSGYATNLGVIQAMLSENDVIVSDSLNHASIIDGARLSRAKTLVYQHTDMNSLEEKLTEAQTLKPGKVLLVTDGVFSMDGDIAPLPDIVKLADRFEAILMVDDAHSSGVLGRNGRGSVDHFNLHGSVDIQIGTLSKALGTMGGYVASSSSLVKYLIQRGRPLLFSTSHPPGVVAATLTALEILKSPEGEHLINTLWENTTYYKGKLAKMGFNTGISQTPITPIITGEASVAREFSQNLFQEGVFAQSITFPTVPRGKARVRTIVTATHSREDLDFALTKMEIVGKKLGII
ncbi:MAG: 8-amino-7-oxononanoate synthase/2-amino-3-ketobutyrate coenzyme A ligase [candidate division WS2 bacterium]|nr:8-amino-7-oxononanoate synthase/2-amino-3-ketobutyrate coenzyme A ligase [Candidatus Lithacetigena glycinireducens]